MNPIAVAQLNVRVIIFIRQELRHKREAAHPRRRFRLPVQLFVRGQELHLRLQRERKEEGIICRRALLRGQLERLLEKIPALDDTTGVVDEILRQGKGPRSSLQLLAEELDPLPRDATDLSERKVEGIEVRVSSYSRLDLLGVRIPEEERGDGRRVQNNVSERSACPPSRFPLR